MVDPPPRLMYRFGELSGKGMTDRLLCMVRAVRYIGISITYLVTNSYVVPRELQSFVKIQGSVCAASDLSMKKKCEDRETCFDTVI
jgi:hypothetical protein